MRCVSSIGSVCPKWVLVGLVVSLGGAGCIFDSSGLPGTEPLENCGNGALDTDEECDATELGGQTCEDQGYAGGGTLACSALCTFDTSGCEGAHNCGNGILDSPEQCDGTELGGQDCTDLGFTMGGQLQCTDGCIYDTVDCLGSGCGDGVLDGGEDCDQDDLGTATCQTVGHDAGLLSCNANCTFDQSACRDVVQNWYDSAWHYRKTITIHASQVDQDESDFPVAIVIKNDTDLQAEGQVDGDDILFTSDDGLTQLSHEIEVYDGGSGTLVAWVKVPSLASSTDTLLYLYYGNPTAANQQDPPNVWDSQFTGVYHLVGDGTVPFPDSSGSGNHATPGNFSADLSVAGQMSQGQGLNGTDQYLQIPTGATSGFDRFTYCFWVNTSESGTDGTYWHRPSLFGQSTSGYSTDDFGITSNDGVLGMWTGLSSGDDDDDGSQVINNLQWRYICAVNDSSTVTLFLDDLGPAGTVPSGGDVNGQAFWLGGRAGEGGGGDFHQGSFDELQISSTNRSPGWLLTSYRNQNQPSTFYTVGIAPEYYLQ